MTLQSPLHFQRNVESFVIVPTLRYIWLYWSVSATMLHVYQGYKFILTVKSTT